MRTRRPRPAPTARSAFAGFRSPPDVIVLAVRWYLRFGLSIAMSKNSLVERGVEVDHVTCLSVGGEFSFRQSGYSEGDHRRTQQRRAGRRRPRHPGHPPAVGIACEPRLFVDPVLCVAARWPDAWQCHELEMPFVVQRDHYILSPYFDLFSYLVHSTWRGSVHLVDGWHAEAVASRGIRSSEPSSSNAAATRRLAGSSTASS